MVEAHVDEVIHSPEGAGMPEMTSTSLRSIGWDQDVKHDNNMSEIRPPSSLKRYVDVMNYEPTPKDVLAEHEVDIPTSCKVRTSKLPMEKYLNAAMVPISIDTVLATVPPWVH